MSSTILLFVLSLFVATQALPLPSFNFNPHSHSHPSTHSHYFLPTRYAIVPDGIIERLDFRLVPIPGLVASTSMIDYTDSQGSTSGYTGSGAFEAISSFISGSKGSKSSNAAGSSADPEHPSLLIEESDMPHLHRFLQRIRVPYIAPKRTWTPEADKIDYVDRPVPPADLAHKMGWDRS
ncbi:hypothetical protein BDQ17DRAFT_1425967 [Cyathus striatus]|nr:hypothetical protein BDQ17DRAFT_1425967 [Cyathus striatus]